MLPADDLLREVTAAASQLPIWGQSLRPLIKEDLLRHLREHGIQRYSEVEFKEERQAVMAEVFGTHSDQLKDLQNCLGHVIEEKITNSLLMDVGTADQDALERAVDLAANAAVTLLGRLRHIDARLFVPRLVAARPNDRLRRILWDRLLLKSDSHRPDHAKECSDRPRGLPQDLLGSSDLRLSRSQTAEVERLVAASPETEPTESSVCTAVVLVLVYGVGPANPRRYEGLLSSTKAWDAAVSHCSDLDAGSWIRRRFVDARVDQEATKLVWDELLFAACWSPAAVPKVLAICTRVLLDLIGRPSGVVSGTAFLEALRSRRSDLLEVICGRGSESIAEVSSCSSLPDHLPQYGTSLDHEEPHNGHHNDPSEGVDAATQTEEDLWNGHGRPGLAVEPWSSYVTDLMAKGGGRVGLSVELRDGRRIQLPIINPFGLVDSVSEIVEHCLIHGVDGSSSSPITTTALRRDISKAVATRFNDDNEVLDDRGVHVRKVTVKLGGSGAVEPTLCVALPTASSESAELLNVCMRAVGRAQLDDQALVMKAVEYLMSHLAHDTE